MSEILFESIAQFGARRFFLHVCATTKDLCDSPLAHNSQIKKMSSITTTITNWSTVPLVCINLDRRPDRLAAVGAELARLGRVFGSADVPTMRVQAVDNPSNGWLGCTMSHLRCVELAIVRGWPAVAILEDDFLCTDPATFLRNTNTFLKRVASTGAPHWDMFMFGTDPNRFVPAPEFGEGVHRVLEAYGSEGYIVNGKYLRTWRDNLREGFERFAAQPHLPRTFGMDVWWHKIMVRDAWLICYPLTVTQAAGISDNENTMQDALTARGKYHTYAGVAKRIAIVAEHQTQCSNVAGYADRVSKVDDYHVAEEAMTARLAVRLVGWAFQVDRMLWRPIRFRDATSGVCTDLDAVRRDDVVAHYGGNSGITWCGWDKTVLCSISEDRKLVGELQMKLDDSDTTTFMTWQIDADP